MSDTHGHDGVGRKSAACACGRCSGWKASKDARRALDVEGDLAANHGDQRNRWGDFIDCECDSCMHPVRVYRRWLRIVSPRLLDRAPLTARPFEALRSAA